MSAVEPERLRGPPGCFLSLGFPLVLGWLGIAELFPDMSKNFVWYTLEQSTETKHWHNNCLNCDPLFSLFTLEQLLFYSIYCSLYNIHSDTLWLVLEELSDVIHIWI